jgi:hypothetical protein
MEGAASNTRAACSQARTAAAAAAATRRRRHARGAHSFSPAGLAERLLDLLLDLLRPRGERERLLLAERRRSRLRLRLRLWRRSRPARGGGEGGEGSQPQRRNVARTRVHQASTQHTQAKGQTQGQASKQGCALGMLSATAAAAPALAWYASPPYAAPPSARGALHLKHCDSEACARARGGQGCKS